MRILYLSLSYVPSRRASSVHVMKMCSALAGLGHEVALATKLEPSRMEEAVDDDHRFYGVEPSFQIVKLRRPAWRGGGLVFLRHARQLARRQPEDTLVYARDLAAALAVGSSVKRLVFEAHAPPSGLPSRLMYKRLFTLRSLRRLVVISHALRRLFQSSGLLPNDLDVVVAPDAADALALPSTSSPSPQLPSGVVNVGYVGHLYPGRGIGLLASLAEEVTGFHFHLVGGSEKDLAAWRRRDLPPSMTLHGFVSPGDLADYYRAFDILVAPYQPALEVASGGDTSAWMSPMKVFEYMAAGKPIIASDLPVLREVLTDGGNALLVPPTDVAGWRAALLRLASEPELAARLANTATNEFHHRYTWRRRAAQVLHGL